MGQRRRLSGLRWTSLLSTNCAFKLGFNSSASLASVIVFSEFVSFSVLLPCFRDLADLTAHLTIVEELGLRIVWRHLLTEATGFHRWCLAATTGSWTSTDFSFKYQLCGQALRHFLTQGTAFPQFRVRLRSSLVTVIVFSEFVKFLASLA